MNVNDYLYGVYGLGGFRYPRSIFGTRNINYQPIGYREVPTRILRWTEPPKDPKEPKEPKEAKKPQKPKPSSMPKDKGTDPTRKTGIRPSNSGPTKKGTLGSKGHYQDPTFLRPSLMNPSKPDNRLYGSSFTKKAPSHHKDKPTSHPTSHKTDKGVYNDGPTKKGTLGRDGRFQDPTFLRPSFMNPSKLDNQHYGSGFTQKAPSHHEDKPTSHPTPHKTGKEVYDDGPTKKGTIGDNGYLDDPTFLKPSFMNPSKPDNRVYGAGLNKGFADRHDQDHHHHNHPHHHHHHHQRHHLSDPLMGLGRFGNQHHNVLGVHPKHNGHHYGRNGFDGYE